MSSKKSLCFLIVAATGSLSISAKVSLEKQVMQEVALNEKNDDFKTRAYQSQSASAKRSKIWERIEATQWQELPSLDGFGWASLLTNLQAAMSLKPTMDYSSDVLPEGRVKFIHAYGVAGLVKFVPVVGSPYSGLFAEETLGIGRLSVAADPKNVSFTPGIGIKFLIDGNPSLNVLAMPSLDGFGESQDFFAEAFTTHIEEPRSPVLKLLSWWFSLTEKEPNKLPVDRLAAITPYGEKVLKPKSPNVLEFVVAPTLIGSYRPQKDEDYRLALLKIVPGTLFQVYSKKTLESGQRVLIGELVLESPLIASEFADKNLFFRHMRKNP